jgi:hypothetical protein
MVVLNDGEMAFIAYRQLPGFETFPFQKDYTEYPDDLELRRQVLEGIRQADIIGTIETAYDGKWRLFFDHYEIPYDRICNGYIGRGLHFTGLLYDQILRNRRVFLLGWYAKNLLPFFEEYGIQLAGMYEGSHQINYFEEIPKIQSIIRKTEFDIAIISAGISSLIFGPWISRELGRCAIDIGSTTGYINRELNQIGSERRDLAIYDPEAKEGFRVIPVELFRG